MTGPQSLCEQLPRRKVGDDPMITLSTPFLEINVTNCLENVYHRSILCTVLERKETPIVLIIW